MKKERRVTEERYLRWMVGACLVSGLLLAACGGEDDEQPSASDVGMDGSGDAGSDPACEGSENPTNNASCACEGTTREFTEGLCDYACVCETGFWGCTEECTEPVEVMLEWGATPEAAEVEGNGNGVPNPGETWEVTGSVRFANATEGQAVTVQLRSDSTKLGLEEPSTSLSNVGDTAVEFSLPFTIQEAATDGLAPLTVEAFGANGLEVIDETIELTVATIPTAILDFTGDDLVEVTGDGNRFIDAGETWKLTITLRNTGDAAAEDLVVEASSSSSSLTNVEVGEVVGTLNAAGQVEVEVTFEVAAEPTEVAAAIQLSATSSTAATASENVDVTVRPPDTLVLLTTRVEQVPDFGNGDAVANDGELWQVVVEIQNTGGFAVEELSWNLLNYTPTSGGEGSGSEEPPYTDLQFGLAEQPTRIAAGATVELLAQNEVAAGMGNIGRLIISANSSLRRHGPFAFDVNWTRP
jgi:hypothetical protein